MEVENKLYDLANIHGDGQGQPTANTLPLQQQGQSQGYVPPYGPPTAPATPYYVPPSGAGYGGGYGVMPSQQLRQQQEIVVGTYPSGPSPVAPVESVASFADNAMAYSCFVMWCCNLMFGLIGYILASEYIVS